MSGFTKAIYEFRGHQGDGLRDRPIGEPSLIDSREELESRIRALSPGVYNIYRRLPAEPDWELWSVVTIHENGRCQFADPPDE